MEVVAAIGNPGDSLGPNMPIAAQIAGPLLIANVLNWGLWGFLCSQLYIFLLSASREDRDRPTTTRKLSLPLPFAAFTSARRGGVNSGLGANGGGEKRRRFRGRQPEEEINPWTVSIAVPPTASINHHERFSSTTSDPYLSPMTADETYVAHAERFSSPSQQPGTVGLGSASGGIAQYPSRPTSSSKLKSKASAGALFTSNADAFQTNSCRKQTLPGPIVRIIMYVLFALVTVQVLLVTAQAWKIIVDSPRLIPREGLVASDVIGPIIFFLSIVFFAHRVYISPLFPPLEPQTPHKSSLRPLSLIKAKTASQPPYSYNINYDTYQHDNNLDQASRNGTNQERNCGIRYEGGGHVQPIPSKWTKFRRCLWTTLGLKGRDLSILSIHSLQPLILVVLAAIVGICELVNGAKLLKDPPPVGAPPLLNGFFSTWLAGTIIIDVFICFCLITSLISSRGLAVRAPSVPWLGRAIRVVGEAGVAQLLVAILALVLIAAWKKDGTPSTIPLVPSFILPALYVNTVFLNATQSYTSSAVFSSPALSHTTNTFESQKAHLTNGKDDIEMGLRGLSRPTSVATQKVIHLGNSAFDSTLTGTNSSSDTGEARAAAIRAAALAYGAEQLEREEAMGSRQVSGGATISAMDGSSARPGAQLTPAAPTSGGAGRLHLERDTLGEGSSAAKIGSGSAGLSGSGRADGPVGSTTGKQGDAPVASALGPGAPKRMSSFSGLSHGALSLELPVFRKGRRVYDVDMPLDWYEDDDDSDSYLSSVDGDGGTWDYGYALNLAMLEREKEKERQEKERMTGTAAAADSATNLTGGATNVTGKMPVRQPRAPRSVRNSYPAFPRSRSVSRRRSAYPLGMDVDSASIVSHGSRRSRRHQSYMPSSHHYVPTGARHRPLPPTPDDTSIMIISDPLREPSIAEPSLFKAASVAATRASTGTMWSSYTYPKPMAFPDLDEDLRDVNTSRVNVDEGGGFYYDPDPAGAGSSALGGGTERDLGDGLAAHPYAAAADEDAERRVRQEESNKRRWRVHPLKRMVEMGRLKR